MEKYILSVVALCVSLTYTVSGQAGIELLGRELEQSTTSCIPKIKAAKKPEFGQNSDNAKGKLLLRYARSGRPREDWEFTDFDVVLVRIGTTWTIVGKAGDRQLDITLDEEAQTLTFILGKYIWKLKTTNPKLSITTAADRSEILIRFTGDIEASGYTGRHYNLMKGSILAVKAGN